MFGNLMIGFAMMVMTSISDVRLYGIEDHVTLYIGAQVPVYAEADHPQGQTLIQWILNQPTYLGIKEDGNEAVLMPRSVGAVDVMARLDDGSYSSRSIYVKTQYYNESTSDFKVTTGIKPIKQYGIDKKTFQVEVESTLSVGEKVTVLKNYLTEIQTYGKLQLESKVSLLDSHLIYTLGVSGYPNRKIEVRLDKSDGAHLELMFVLENLQLLNSSSSSQLPEIEQQEEQLKDSHPPFIDEVVDDEFENIKDKLLNITGNTGNGSSELPFQLTLDQLLSHHDLVTYLNEAWLQGKLSVSEIGNKHYRLRLQSLQIGSANELYIEVIDASSDEDDLLKEEPSTRVPKECQRTNDDEILECDSVDVTEDNSALEHLNVKKEENVLMEMKKYQTQDKALYPEPKLADEPLKQSILSFHSKKYYVVASLILLVLVGYSGYLWNTKKNVK